MSADPGPLLRRVLPAGTRELTPLEVRALAYHLAQVLLATAEELADAGVTVDTLDEYLRAQEAAS